MSLFLILGYVFCGLFLISGIVYIFLEKHVLPDKDVGIRLFTLGILLGAFLTAFGLLSEPEKRTTHESVNVIEIVKGKHVLFVVTDRNSYEFKGYEMDAINDSTKFIWKIKHNHFNSETRRTMHIDKID